MVLGQANRAYGLGFSCRLRKDDPGVIYSRYGHIINIFALPVNSSPYKPSFEKCR